MSMYIPIIIVVVSNTFYHICAKSTPEGINTFAALSVTYTVSAVASLVLFFITQRSSLIAEYHKLNWSSFILGIAVVGLEAGFILMYKAGWNVSTGQLVASAILAVALIVVGVLLYKEVLNLRKLIGIAVCMLGLVLINK